MCMCPHACAHEHTHSHTHTPNENNIHSPSVSNHTSLLNSVLFLLLNKCNKGVQGFILRHRESVWESRPMQGYVLGTSFPMEDGECVLHKNSFACNLRSYFIHMRIKEIHNWTRRWKSATSLWCFCVSLQVIHSSCELYNYPNEFRKERRCSVLQCTGTALKIWIIWYFINSKIDITLPQISHLNWLPCPDKLPRLSWEYK